MSIATMYRGDYGMLLGQAGLQGLYQQGVQQGMLGQMASNLTSMVHQRYVANGQWIPEESQIPNGAIKLGPRDFDTETIKIARNEQEWLDHRVDEMRVKL